MTDPLPEDQRLKDISPKAYEHPADRAATAALQSIPMLDVVVRKLIEFGYERALRQIFLAGSVKLGPDQLPELWAAHRAACARLDLPEIPDLYLTQFPIANAAAIGADQPIVLVNSRTVELLDEHEMRTVLGHEAGHILSEHVLYRTALMILLSSASRAAADGRAAAPGVRLALLEWFRASELSCDRAATLVNRDPLVTCRTLMVLAGGVKSKKLNLDTFLKQAERVRGVGARLGPALAPAHRAGADPRGARCAACHELMKWVRSGEYDRVMGGEYVRRGDPVAPATRPATPPILRRALPRLLQGRRASVDKAGDKVGDAAEKMTDWLRERR